jgi:peptide/histidine transporter 3/4
MMEKMNPEAKEDDEMKWVHDSSVDHKGRIPLRASTGSWKAALFIFGKNLMLLNCSSST